MAVVQEHEQLFNPFPWYQAMRQSRPVHFDEERCTWNVFRYQDVQRVLTDYEAFSSQMMMEGSHALSSSMINVDPPRHRQLRSLVTQAFTPRTIARLALRVSDIVHELLDRVVAKGEMDVIDDLSYPLPVLIIAELLGVPAGDRDRFRHWSNIIAGTDDGGGYAAQQEMAEYFLALLADRRREPQDDLLSALLAAQVDGQKLTQEELLGFCVLLLVAGNITTTNLIGNAFLAFQQVPPALEQLYADSSLIPNAIEEVLRYLSPVRCMFRVSMKETVFGDQRIGAGQFVVAWIASANRDEEVFPDADMFDIRRSPNRHVGFGHGIHYCLGAPLARLEAKIALEIMLERLKQIRMVPDALLEPVISPVLYGVKHVPITFEAVH